MPEDNVTEKPKKSRQQKKAPVQDPSTPEVQVKPADPPRPPEPTLPPPEVDRPSTEPITAWEEMLVRLPTGSYALRQIGEIIPVGSFMADGSTIKPPMTDSLGRVSRPVTQVLPGATEDEIAKALAQGMVLDTTRPLPAMPHPSRGPGAGTAPPPVVAAPRVAAPPPVVPPRPSMAPLPVQGGPRETVLPKPAPVPPAPVESFSEPAPVSPHPTILWPPGDKVTPTLEGLPLRQGDPIEFVHKGQWVGGYAIVEDKGPNQRMIGAYLAGRPMGASPANGERVPIPPSTPAYHANPKGYSFIPGNHNSLREGGALPTGASLTRYPCLVRIWDKEPGAWVRGALSRPQDDRVVFVSEEEILAGKGPWDIPGRLATDAAVHFPEDSKFCDWANVVTAVRRSLTPEQPDPGYEAPPRPGSREEAAAWAGGNYMTPHPGSVSAPPQGLHPMGYVTTPSHHSGPEGNLPRPIVALPPIQTPGRSSVFSPAVLSPEALTRVIMVCRARFHTSPLLVQNGDRAREISDDEICDLAVLILGAAGSTP